MADISKISPDGGTTEYNIKDATARTDVSTINGKIPSGASSSNKMATASDVNAKISWADAGKYISRNELILDFTTIKSLNDTGTWSGNAYTVNGVTFTFNSDKTVSITQSGNATGNADFRFGYFDVETGKILSGCPSDSDPGNNWYLMFAGTTIQDTGNGKNIDSAISNKLLYFRVVSGKNANGKIIKPMIRSVNTPADFQPHIPDNTELMSWEANAKTGVHNFLLPLPLEDIHDNGITYSSNNGIITATGTAESQSYGRISYGVLPAGIYKFSGISGGSDSTYYLDVNLGSQRVARVTDGEVNITLDGTSELTVWVNIKANYACPTGGIQFKPMLTTPDDTLEDFTEGVMTNKELTKRVFMEGYAGASWTAEADTKYIGVLRCGKLVQVFGYINPTTAVSIWGEVLTNLPKPRLGSYASDAKHNASFALESSGDVGHIIAATALAVGTQYTFAFCYLTF